MHRKQRVAAIAAAAAAAGALMMAGPAVAMPPDPHLPSALPPASPTTLSLLPTPDHVVIVMEENRSYDDVASAPYLEFLRGVGADMTDSYAVGHPSERNYLALWSGSTQGLTRDTCPHTFPAPSLGKQLLTTGRTVAGYFESMPSAGYLGCASGLYVRRHNPLADFRATSGPTSNLPMTAFPTDFAQLPTVSLVVPNLNDDMHDGSVSDGDRWLEDHLSDYQAWAQTHNSVLIVTWDEDDRSASNHIDTVITGEHVAHTTSGMPITHYNVLHTIEQTYGLPLLGPEAAPIADVWQ
jgi:phosphatidylinositol-3-phosphatase